MHKFINWAEELQIEHDLKPRDSRIRFISSTFIDVSGVEPLPLGTELVVDTEEESIYLKVIAIQPVVHESQIQRYFYLFKEASGIKQLQDCQEGSIVPCFFEHQTLMDMLRAFCLNDQAVAPEAESIGLTLLPSEIRY